MKIFKKLRNLSKKKKFLLALAIIGAGVGLAYALGFIGNGEPEAEQPPEPIYSQLMGIEVEQEVADRPILGIMIENHPDARPQTGVDAAGIVFESVTEGGITRYLALYQENMPKEVGPIRSVRPYFVNWLMGFDASIAHVGGSAPALAALDSRNANTLSQFQYPNEYHRVNTRYSHNMYAKTADLQKLQKKLGHDTADFPVILRSPDSPSAEPNATKIGITYSYADFNVEFRYNKAKNTYTRYLAGSPDIDAATKKPITVKNLVVIKMRGSSVNAIGSGVAIIYKDGTKKTARWKQASFRDRLTLIDSEGNEVPLNRGDSWFAVLPSSGSVSD